jgi:hypothetical protein
MYIYNSASDGSMLWAKGEVICYAKNLNMLPTPAKCHFSIFSKEMYKEVSILLNLNLRPTGNVEGDLTKYGG